LLVVANGDKGLAGAFNANIVKAAVARARQLIARGKTVKFYLVGRKGRAVIARTFPGLIVGEYDTTVVRTPGFTEAQAVAQDISNRFLAGEFDVAHLFYAAFRSALVQAPTEQQIIPVAVPADAPASSGAAVEYEPD